MLDVEAWIFGLTGRRLAPPGGRHISRDAAFLPMAVSPTRMIPVAFDLTLLEDLEDRADGDLGVTGECTDLD